MTAPRASMDGPHDEFCACPHCDTPTATDTDTALAFLATRIADLEQALATARLDAYVAQREAVGVL